MRMPVVIVAMLGCSAPAAQGPAPPVAAAGPDAGVDAGVDAATDAAADAATEAELGYDRRWRRPPPSTPEEMTAQLRRQCMAADVFACIGLAGELERGGAAERAEAESLYRLVCSDKNLCVPLAGYLRGVGTRAARTEATKVLRDSCKAGAQEACAER